MASNRSKRVLVVAAVASSLFLLNFVWAASSHDPHSAQQVSLLQLQGKTVPGALQALMATRKAIRAGHTEHALAELRKVEMALLVAQKTLDVEIGPKFVNATCPMMGSPIEADKVTDDLIRVYQGKRIAFCCDGCPQKWDDLSRVQKVAKLAESMSKPAASHNHAGHDHAGHAH